METPTNKMVGLNMLDRNTTFRQGKIKHYVIDILLFKILIRQLDSVLRLLKNRAYYFENYLTSNIEVNCFIFSR
jgi:hypothetical protein